MMSQVNSVVLEQILPITPQLSDKSLNTEKNLQMIQESEQDEYTTSEQLVIGNLQIIRYPPKVQLGAKNEIDASQKTEKQQELKEETRIIN